LTPFRAAKLNQNRTALRSPAPGTDADCMTQTLAATRQFRLVRPDDQPSGWFCGHCAARFDQRDSASIPRVCPSCSLGMVLQASEDVIPDASTPFLIVDSSLTVQALSAQAERTLGISEERAVNRHVTELLIPGDAEPSAAGSLAGAITTAAAGDDPVERVAVRPSNTFGIRMFARIAACGPPRAALITLD
jgi:hypothetical protein